VHALGSDMPKTAAWRAVSIVRLADYTTLESIAPIGDDPVFSLPWPPDQPGQASHRTGCPKLHHHGMRFDPPLLNISISIYTTGREPSMAFNVIFLIMAIVFGSATGWDPFGAPVHAQEMEIEQPIPPMTLPEASVPFGTVSLRGGWTDFAPFQSRSEGKLEGAEGLDVEILSDVLSAAGMEAQLHKRNWQDQLRDLSEGRSDIAIGAFLPADGDDRFDYSLPYRWARLSLYVRAADQVSYDAADVGTLLRETPDFRLGVIPGRLFHDPELNRSIERAERAGLVTYAQSDEENLRNLVRGEIDGFFGDRLGVSATALKSGLKFEAAEVVMPGTAGVHIVFSKKTVPAETVARINAAIRMLENEGVLKERLHSRIFSVVMGYALDSLAFKILAIVGTVAFAVSGVLIAYREDFSFFGALVLSALPAVGGGALRDILFDRHPIGVMSDPLYLCLVVATVVAGFCVIVALRLMRPEDSSPSSAPTQRRILTISNIQETCDAAGMAAFTVSGLAVAVSIGTDPLWLWGPIAAMLSAAGGGILRDIVRQSGKVSALKDEFYAEVPLIWGLAFSLFLLTRPSVLAPEEVGIAIVLTVVGAFLTRMAVVLFGLRAFPFRWPPRRATDRKS